MRDVHDRRACPKYWSESTIAGTCSDSARPTAHCVAAMQSRKVRRDYDVRRVAVHAVERDVEIALLGLGRDAGRGPVRITSTTTTGTSATTPSPSDSIMSETGPGSRGERGQAAEEAPSAMLMEASSSSACTSVPPTSVSAGASHSRSSVAGVIGYAATKRTPPRSA